MTLAKSIGESSEEPNAEDSDDESYDSAEERRLEDEKYELEEEDETLGFNPMGVDPFGGESTDEEEEEEHTDASPERHLLWRTQPPHHSALAKHITRNCCP